MSLQGWERRPRRSPLLHRGSALSQRTQDNRKRRRDFPADGLIPLLQRFVVAPGSTAGIEQNFSKMKRVLGEQWNGSEQAEERRCVLELAIQQQPEPWGELMSEAGLSGPRLAHPARGAHGG